MSQQALRPVFRFNGTDFGNWHPEFQQRPSRQIRNRRLRAHIQPTATLKSLAVTKRFRRQGRLANATIPPHTNH